MRRRSLRRAQTALRSALAWARLERGTGAPFAIEDEYLIELGAVDAELIALK